MPKPKPYSSASRTARENAAPSRAPIARPHSCSAAARCRRGRSADQHEIVQHRVRRQQHVAGARALRGEEAPGEDQQRGADEDVAVDDEQADELFAVEDVSRRRACRAPTIRNARTRPTTVPTASATTAPSAAPATP